jgi:hypothetical protein
MTYTSVQHDGPTWPRSSFDLGGLRRRALLVFLAAPERDSTVVKSDQDGRVHGKDANSVRSQNPAPARRRCLGCVPRGSVRGDGGSGPRPHVGGWRFHRSHYRGADRRQPARAKGGTTACLLGARFFLCSVGLAHLARPGAVRLQPTKRGRRRYVREPGLFRAARAPAVFRRGRP